MLIVGVVPVPLSATVCDPALSVTVRVPVSAPALEGANRTEIWQEAAAARLDPQVLVCGKSAELVIPLIVREADPVLVRVTGEAAL
jgi:hypothetical protein